MQSLYDPENTLAALPPHVTQRLKNFAVLLLQTRKSVVTITRQIGCNLIWKTLKRYGVLDEEKCRLVTQHLHDQLVQARNDQIMARAKAKCLIGYEEYAYDLLQRGEAFWLPLPEELKPDDVGEQLPFDFRNGCPPVRAADEVPVEYPCDE